MLKAGIDGFAANSSFVRRAVIGTPKCCIDYQRPFQGSHSQHAEGGYSGAYYSGSIGCIFEISTYFCKNWWQKRCPPTRLVIDLKQLINSDIKNV
jgi:hypothetical protein